MNMKNIAFFFILFCVGCSPRDDIKLNDIQVEFTDFAETDSLLFASLSEEIIEEPSEMKLWDNFLIINDFNKSGDNFISFYSLEKNEIIETRMNKGMGPGEMLSCSINILGDDLWLYDMSKSNIVCFPLLEISNDRLKPLQYQLSKYYYDIAMLNDTIMVGSNDLTINKKISFVNIKNGDIRYSGEYSYVNPNIPMSSFIDACNSYIEVNPKTKDILLAYRYTDVIEIYDSEENLKNSVHGPDCFEIKFQPGSYGMRKTKETRKAFVNAYVTEKHIYLLYSGCTREEKNWSDGNEIFVYSWSGVPEKRYILNQPVYSFAVDECSGYIYSYSLESSELIKAVM